MDVSTAVPRDFVTEFLSNPVNRRVCLPDGSLAVVRTFRDTDQGRLYKVQGLDGNGRFCAIQSLSCWFSGSELRLHYFTARIDPKWSRS